MPPSGSRTRRTWKDPFLLKTKRTDLGQEILAGTMGWMTVVSSVAFYANLFVGDDEDLNLDATVEVYLIVAGLSSIAFGAMFNLPFIVAPSVLYAAREAGMAVGGHLASQIIANLLAAAFFALSLKLSFVTFVPTALRLGAGYGTSMMVSVLGLRSLGLLVSNSFTLQLFTWQSIVGLGVITFACAKVSNPTNNLKKWLCIILVPEVLTLLVYAVTDRTKFEGFPSEIAPLSNMGEGSLGAASFYEIWDAPKRHCFYIVRTVVSIIITISSILLVLIDVVCLEEIRTKVKTSVDSDIVNAIGGTKKFRCMASTIPLMSCFGNLLGVTTQAAFVQTMMLVFVGGKTGLGAVVTGALFILSVVLRPILPILAPGHISGALAVVISLRYFTVIRMIDVTRASSLLMLGMPILLIPFSFDFVDALCIAAVMGFLCEAVDMLALLWVARSCARNNKVAVSAPEKGEREKMQSDANSLDCEDGELPRLTETRPTGVGVVADRGGGSNKQALPSQMMAGHLVKDDVRMVRALSAPTLPAVGGRPPSLKAQFQKYGTSRHAHGRIILSKIQPARDPKHRTLPPKPQPQVSWSSKYTYPSTTSGGGNSACKAEAELAGPAAVHWALALVAMLELVLSAISDRTQDNDR